MHFEVLVFFQINKSMPYTPVFQTTHQNTLVVNRMLNQAEFSVVLIERWSLTSSCSSLRQSSASAQQQVATGPDGGRARAGCHGPQDPTSDTTKTEEEKRASWSIIHQAELLFACWALAVRDWSQTGTPSRELKSSGQIWLNRGRFYLRISEFTQPLMEDGGGGASLVLARLMQNKRDEWGF